VVATNPHNQTFAVAIQLGLCGAILLYAMWIAHLALFREAGLPAWIGMVVVVQNFVSSLFNSHLFDFTQGWIYVVGVGVAGGTVLRQRAKASATGAPVRLAARRKTRLARRLALKAACRGRRAWRRRLR
jgi:hypothetical protein